MARALGSNILEDMPKFLHQQVIIKSTKMPVELVSDQFKKFEMMS